MARADGSPARRGAPRRALTGGLVAVGVLAVAGLAGWLADADADPVVEVPAVGEVAPAWLTDDLPVLLVHDTDGLVAFDARSPVATAGRRGLLGWCADERQIVDPVAQRTWTAEGEPFAGRGEALDEPQPALASWDLELEGQGRLARVGEHQPAQRRPPVERAALWSRCQPGDLAAPDPLARDAAPVAASSLAGRDDGLHAVRGVLEQVGQAAPRLCEEGADAGEPASGAGTARPAAPRCGPGALTTALGDWQPARLPAPDEGLALRLEGDLLVSVEAGAVVEALVPPPAAEPERAVVTGELVVRGTVVDAVDDRGAIGLPGVAEGTWQVQGPRLVLADPRLVDAPARLPRGLAGHRALVPLAEDVALAEALAERAAATASPAALPEVLDGVEVRVVVDRASGRAERLEPPG